MFGVSGGPNVSAELSTFIQVSYSNLEVRCKSTTEPIKRVLSNYNIKVSQKPHQTIGNLFPKPKDPVPKDQTRGAIYSIPCKDCD